jgi:opacity protein-like surface antigen
VPTDVKVEYLHVGAIYAFNRGRVRPFFGGTVGATRLSPDAPGLNSDTNFSLGLAGGVKPFLTKHVGLRLEGRVFATQVDSDSAAFCTNGSCRIFYDGDFLWQYTANAGIVIGF